MDIIKRNFFKILRCGALNDKQPIEPMSQYKWTKLIKLAMINGVEAIVAKSFSRYLADNDDAIPVQIAYTFIDSQKKSATSSVIEVPEAQLSNFLLNKRLTGIRLSETDEQGKPSETIVTLNIIIYNINQILSIGVDLNMMLCLGKYLRMAADKIDGTKLRNWLKSLHIQRMAQIEADILVYFLGFEEEEVPFFTHSSKGAEKILMHSVDTMGSSGRHDDITFGQNRAGFLHNDTHAVGHKICRAISYMRYSPIEASSNLIKKFAISLSKIEE